MDLTNENIPSSSFEALARGSEFSGESSSVDSRSIVGNAGRKLGKVARRNPKFKSAVMRYDPDLVKEHIKNAMLRNSKETTFHGVEELKKAANEGLLRQGQLIFGTVSIAHHEDKEGTIQGWLYNTLTPFIMQFKTGQMRTFAYLHTSVYAGKYEGRDYVIENGGANSYGIGTIDVSLLEEAFEKDARFFVVSPPKDSKRKSTRYLVLQRALASIGLKYIYNMRVVSCETFATALLGLLSEDYFTPLQLEVLRSHKQDHPDKDGQKAKDIIKFKEFHEDLCKQIEKVPTGTILTLKFYITCINNNLFEARSKKPWFLKMSESYTRYIEAAKSGDTQTCLDLLKLGLNPEGRSPNYTETAVKMAVHAGHWETVEALVKAGADPVDLLVNEALIQAGKLGHSHNISSLLYLGANIEHQDTRGSTALTIAAYNGHTATVTLLLTHGAHIEHQTTNGHTALTLAALNGHTATVTLLLTHGANIEHQDTHGHTALTLAALNGHTATVTLLLTHGALIEHQSKQGNTALTIAAQEGRIDTVTLLLTHGALIEHQTTYGNTALTIAADNGHTDIVTLLLTHRANETDTLP